MKALVLSLLILTFLNSDTLPQSKVFFYGYLETSSPADKFYRDGNKFLNGIGVGYTLNEYLDFHSSFSFMEDKRSTGTKREYIADAYSFALGVNIKPFGTIIKNEQWEFGHFTPYIGIDLKRKTIYDFYPYHTAKGYDVVLINNLGGEFSLTNRVNVLTGISLKSLLAESTELEGHHAQFSITRFWASFFFGLKYKI